MENRRDRLLDSASEPAEPPRTPRSCRDDDDDDDDDDDSKLAAQVSPPYWVHHRSASQTTQTSLDIASPITLSDNTLPHSRSHSLLWAKSISIEDYVIVNGKLSGIPGVGSYVVWNCEVQTLDGGPMTIRKRYSEFVELREGLTAAFPQSTLQSLPQLPPKSVVYKFRPEFLEKRRQGLNYFLNCVMLNPEYAGSRMVKDFIFA